MSQQGNRHNEIEDRDLIDSIPVLNRAATNLQRAVGPSCLLSLVITALVVILLRRYMHLPLTGMAVMTGAIWWAVLVVLVRLGGPVPDDEE